MTKCTLKNKIKTFKTKIIINNSARSADTPQYYKKIKFFFGVLELGYPMRINMVMCNLVKLKTTRY